MRLVASRETRLIEINVALNRRSIVKLSMILLNQQDHAADVRETDANRRTKPQSADYAD